MEIGTALKRGNNMKVIGIGENSGDLICVINKVEIAKVFGNSWIESSEVPRSLHNIRVGDTVRLDEGYDFKQHIVNVCHKMVDATAEFSKSQDTLLKFSEMVVKNGKPHQE